MQHLNESVAALCNLKAALINIFLITTNQMSMCEKLMFLVSSSLEFLLSLSKSLSTLTDKVNILLVNKMECFALEE